MRRYGAQLWLRDQLARRLGLRGLGRAAFERMQAIDLAHLEWR